MVILMSMTICLSSCGDKSDEPGNSEQLSERAQEIYNKLNDTTWALVSSPYEKSPLGSTITFSSSAIFPGAYYLYCSYYPNDVFAWLPAPDDEMDLQMVSTLTHCDPSNGGSFSVLFGAGAFVSFSGNKMTLISAIDNDTVYVYSKVSSNSGNDNDGADGYEKPDVEFYDYTQQGSSSVKVDFIIYNKEEAGVSTASIKYGKTASANTLATTNIIGNHVTATISGLKANTKYYVKCTVKGKGGSVTTDAVPISLTSW